MSLELNALFSRAATAADGETYKAADDGGLDRGRKFLGISLLSKANNKAATERFMEAIEKSPAYGRLFTGDLRAPLEALAKSSRPLTAATVRQTRLALDGAAVTAAVAFGRELVESGAIPPGHATSFGQHAVAHGFSVASPQGRVEALRGYLQGLCEEHPADMTRLPGDSNGERAGMLLRIFGERPPSEGSPTSFIKKLVSAKVDELGEAVTMDALRGAWAEGHASELRAASCLSDEALAAISLNAANGRGGQILNTLALALPSIGEECAEAFVSELVNAQPQIELETESQRAQAVRTFMVNVAGEDAAARVLADKGLPKDFTLALGHNPEVIGSALGTLREAGELFVPSRKTVIGAFEQATRAFIDAHRDDLAWLAQAMTNPPAGSDHLREALSARRMPALVNAVIAELPILRSIASADAGRLTEPQLVEAFGRLAAASRSAAHAVQGDFGAADNVNALTDAICVSLLREGVPGERLPELMARVVSEFGGVSSDLTSAFDLILDPKLLGETLNLIGAIEAQASALISLMTDDQLRDLNLAFYMGGKNPGEDTLRERSRFVRSSFESVHSTSQAGDGARLFFHEHGVELDDADPNLQRPDAIAGGNLLMAQTVARQFLSSLFPEGAMGPGPKSAAFMNLFNEVAQTSGLAGLDPERLGLDFAAEEVRAGLIKLSDEAAREGRRIDPAALSAEARGILAREIRGCAAALAAVRALPRETAQPALVEVFSGVIERHCLSQPTGLIEFANHLSVGPFISDLASPCPTERQIIEGLELLAVQVCASFGGLTDVRTGRIVSEIISDFARGMDGGMAQALADLLESPAAEKTAAAMRFSLEPPKATAHSDRLMFMLDQMDAIHARLRPESPRQPSLAGEPVTHPSQISAGANGLQNKLATLVGAPFSTISSALTDVKRVPDQKTWDALARIAKDLDDGTSILGYASASWVAQAAPALEDALRKAAGKPLSLKALWACLTDGALGRLPASVKRPQDLPAAVDGLYRARLQKIAPGADGMTAIVRLGNATSAGLPLAKAVGILKPGASITLADLGREPILPSLRDVTPDSNYGLSVDLVRLDPQSRCTLTPLAGEAVVTTAGAVRADRDFNTIIDCWRGMTRSEAQLRRVAQTFTQAALLEATFFGSAFPGVPGLSEHGRYDIDARQLQDGAVEVTVSTSETCPVRFQQVWRIETDGSYRCTDFLLERAQQG